MKGHSNKGLNLKQLPKNLGHFLLSGGATKLRFYSPSYVWSLRKLPSETSITLLDMKSLSWSIVGMVIKLTKQKLKVFILTWLWLKKQESE